MKLEHFDIEEAFVRATDDAHGLWEAIKRAEEIIQMAPESEMAAMCKSAAAFHRESIARMN